jgi:hypothetical protein
MRAVSFKALGLIVCVAVWGAACQSDSVSAPSDDPVAARAVVSRLQDRIRLQVSKEPERPEVSPLDSAAPAHAALNQEEWAEISAAGDAFEARFSLPVRGTMKPAGVKLPVFADAPFEVRDPETAVSVEAKLKGAVRAPGVVSDGFLVYRDVMNGASLVQQPILEGSEDYLWLEKAVPNDELVYEVTLGRNVAGLRHVSNTIEFLDAGGAPRLRVNAPYLVDARGNVHEVTLALRGCAADESTAMPWGRPVTPPGATHCEIVLTWEGISWWNYPIMVDPVWTTTGSMATAREDHQAINVSNSRVIVSGGMTTGSAATSSVEAWDFSTKTWASLGNMNGARANHTMTLVDATTFVVTGGRTGTANNTITNTTERCSFSGALSCSSAGNLGAARAYHAAIQLSSVSSNRMLVTGGMGTGGNAISTTEYAASSTSWSNTITGMNTGRYRFRLVALSNTTLLAFGGQNSAGALSSAEILTYSSLTSSWANTGSMASARANPAMVVLSNGNIMAIGGDSAGSALSSSEIFDTGSKTWSSASAMSTTRTYAAAVVLADGSVVVTGGASAPTSAVARSTTERYASSAWGSTLSMNSSRYLHTATELKDGWVLVAGGRSGTSPTRTAEVLNIPLTCSSNSNCESGFCTDGYCCDAACSGGACDRCDTPGSEGICTVQTSTSDGTPSCSPYLCSGSSGACATSCTTSAQCHSSAYCSGSTCVPKLAKGEVCTSSASCQSGSCSDGFCCDKPCNGGCDVCSAAAGASANGTCTILASGSTGQNPSCNPFLCDGAASGACPISCTMDNQCATGAVCIYGACYNKVNQGSACVGNAQCNNNNCVDGYCCDTACSNACDACDVPGKLGTCSTAPQGRTGSPSCSPFACDGTNLTCPATCTGSAQCPSSSYCSNGTCLPKVANGGQCSAPGQCASNFCADGVCCNSVCPGPCATCSASRGATADGQCTVMPATSSGPGNNGACDPYRCSGTSNACATNCSVDANCLNTAYCTAANTCVPRKLPGATCTRDSECSTSACIEGFCCDRDCRGQCDACSKAKGAVADGTCTPLPLGTTPSPDECGSYLCDGEGFYCATTCKTDAACAAGKFCSNGSCVDGLNLGSACTKDRQCNSGFCTDGVCCSSACDGSCTVCSQALGASIDGTCTGLPKGNPGRNNACSPFSCTGNGGGCAGACMDDGDCAPGNFCTPQGLCVPAFSNGAACERSTQCTSRFCTDGVCCNSACDGQCAVCAKAFGAATNGVCQTAPQGSRGSPECYFFVCDGQQTSCPTTCSSNSQCNSDSFCYQGPNSSFCVPKNSNGLSCTSAAQCASGKCVDGYCCDSDCQGSCNACSRALGASENGVCTILAQGSVGLPACSPGRCNGTSSDCSLFCVNDADCSGSSWCSNGTCLAKKDNGGTCSSTLECKSGLCFDGVCCNTTCSGACDSCNLPASKGTCTPLPVGSEGSPSCGELLCSGTANNCPTACSSDAMCRPGTFCLGGSCVPTQANGAYCSRGTECASGSCSDGFCCDSACSGSCDVCAKSLGASDNGTCTLLPAGSRGSPSCTPYYCDGQSATCSNGCKVNGDCVAGDYCAPDGHCQHKVSNGGQCRNGGDCSSGYCVDGFCCNSACTDQCAACDISGKEGTCSPNVGEPHGTRADCASDGSACGGQCDGSNTKACTFPSSAVSCGASTCQNNRNTPASTCNGAGACVASTAVDCTPYQCVTNVGCLSRCAQDPDCVGGAFCLNGACVPLRGLSDICSKDSECVSGHCADGYCCDSACTGACARCNAPNREGLCTALPALTRDEEGECAPYLCDGVNFSCPEMCQSSSDCAAGFICIDGECTGKQATGRTCKLSSECASGFCVDGFCCESSCKGSCATCGQSGNEGRCVLVTGAAAPNRPACAGEGFCGGTCTGLQSDCSYPDESKVCAPAFCSNGVATSESTCNGAGSCEPKDQETCPTGCSGDTCAAAVPVKSCSCTSGEGALAGFLLAGAQLAMRWRRRRGAGAI